HWLGYVADRPTYLDALASCDVFVSPSTAEGFPKVVLDAMAVGLPVVATPSGALDELVAGRRIVSAGGDADGLAAAVSALVQRPETARVLRERGLALAADHT